MQCGPYDGTPKRPTAGATLHFWQTEEGLKTLEAHPELGARASLQPSWSTMPPKPVRAPYFPTGVYLDNPMPNPHLKNPIPTPHRHVPADDSQGESPCGSADHGHPAEFSDDSPFHVGDHVDYEENGVPDSADLGFAAAGNPARFASENVSENRPHTRGDKVELAMADWPDVPQGQLGDEKPYGTLPRTLRTPGFDVDGAPRKSMPRLSGTFARAAVAAASQRNEKYMATEGGVMRPVRTASASLARWAALHAVRE